MSGPVAVSRGSHAAYPGPDARGNRVRTERMCDAKECRRTNTDCPRQGVAHSSGFPFFKHISKLLHSIHAFNVHEQHFPCFVAKKVTGARTPRPPHPPDGPRAANDGPQTKHLPHLTCFWRQMRTHTSDKARCVLHAAGAMTNCESQDGRPVAQRFERLNIHSRTDVRARVASERRLYITKVSRSLFHSRFRPGNLSTQVAHTFYYNLFRVLFVMLRSLDTRPPTVSVRASRPLSRAASKLRLQVAFRRKRRQCA